MKCKFWAYALIAISAFAGCQKPDDDTEKPGEEIQIPELPADPQPANTSFKHRIMLLQHTGTACPNCPRLMTSLKAIAEDPEYSGRYHHVAAHSYNVDDPAYSTAAKQISQPFCSAYPELSFNLDGETAGGDTSVETIKGFIDKLQNETAEAGISAAAQLTGNSVAVNVQIKSAKENEYRIAAWILEDDIYAEQDGASEEWMHTHENALRAFSGASLNMGIYGEKAGSLKAGATAEKTFIIDLDEEWKAENCKVFVLVNSSKDGKYDVANCAICPIGGSVTYDYK